MKKNWAVPELKQMDVSCTEYNQVETTTFDAYIYDADSGKTVEIKGYMDSGLTTK